MRPAVLASLAVAVAAALAQPAAAEAEVVWLCKPGMADNPCEIPQDTTIQEQDGSERVVTPEEGPREIDCFYVYPTVSNQMSPNADKTRDPELESIAKYQAARFSLECRVFAPIYRQATLYSIGAGMAGGESGADRELAYGDVLEAWEEYLAKHNDGRGVVLIGHSQGTFMLRSLLGRAIEQERGQLRRIVSALLIGGDVEVAKGKLTGGDFKRTPLCTREAQVGCVVAYSTFAEDPPEDARFGTTTTEGREVACTDPRLLAGFGEPLRSLTPSEEFATGPIQTGFVITYNGSPPSAETTWVTPPDHFEGTCEVINGAHVLRMEPTPGSSRPMWFPDESWGTHLIDVNIVLDPLIQLVAAQAARWTDPRVKLRRRCTARGLRLRVTGRDADFVDSAVFRLGNRRIGRDRRAPFKTLIRKRALRKSPARKVRTRVRLRHGEPDRLTLKRGVGGCAQR